jgi:sigma-B regulation protein RsbU (phosphoserine phosphatase)
MNSKPLALLLVDDDPVFTLFARQLALSLPGGETWRIVTADSGEAGLARVRQERFDLALVDYHLPGVSGLDFLAAVGQMPAGQQPAVIMLTGSGSESVAVEAMKRGAKDYLQKNELDLPSLMRAVQSALAQKRLAEQVAAYNAQIKADLEMAHKLQESLLPQSYPVFPPTAAPEDSALRFQHRYFWTTQLGGDFFSVQNLSDTAAGILICDVMGHGVRPALVTAMLRALVGDLEMHFHDPGIFLQEMNRRLAAILKQIEEPLYATAIYLVADVAAGELRYAKAGHPAPFHLQAATGLAESLPFPNHAGAALGLFERGHFVTCRRPLAAGDRILLFTDGLYEIANDAGEEFGLSRLLDAARRRRALPLGELMDGLIAEVRAHNAEDGFDDDVCLLGMEVARSAGKV